MKNSIKVTVEQIGSNESIDSFLRLLQTDESLNITIISAGSTYPAELISTSDLWIGVTSLSCEETLENLRDSTGVLGNLPVILLDKNYEIDKREIYLKENISEYLNQTSFSLDTLKFAINISVRIFRSVREVQVQRSKFDLLKETLSVGTWDWDLRKNSFFWSAREYELFGIDAKSKVLVYTSWRDAIHAEDRDRVEAELGRAIVGEADFHSVFRVWRRNLHNELTLHWIEGAGRVQRDENGAAFWMYGLNWDVTTKYRALADLEAKRNCSSCLSHQSKNPFQIYFEQSVDCLFHIAETTDGILLYTAVNPSGLRHVGLPLERILGRAPSEVLGKDIGGTIEAGVRHVIRTGDPFYYKPTFDMGEGSVVYDAVYIPIKNEHGLVTGVLGCARDITAGRRLEESLFQAQKMEALGQLTGGTAHDFNNLLQNLSGALDILQNIKNPDAAHKAFKICRASIKCGYALTSALLSFSRRENISTEETDLGELVKNLTEIVNLTVGARVTVHIKIDHPVWTVNVSKQQVELAIINLVINARDAMPEGGVLTIGVTNTKIAMSDKNIVSGDYVCLMVTDTGQGMSPSVIARAGEEFYTTKPAGKGTGLGLSMVRLTVSNFGGQMKIASALGKGTSVALYFPAL